jgi:phosphoribosyl 1,2-cyclic phosphodiesterase
MEKTVLYIGGCSGSSSPEFSRNEFGNLTTAFGILSGTQGIFIDNGSGITKVATFLLAHKVTEVYGLQTHFHGDHRQGIHGNKLLFTPSLTKEIHAPRLCYRSFREIIERDFSEETWPIAPRDIPILEFEPGSTLLSPVPIETLLQNHPGGSVAYRVTSRDGDIVISTDGEPVGRHGDEMAEFISEAALFYMDVQYRQAEYDGTLGICGGPKMSRVGWGHGTPEMLFDILSKCKVPPKKIIIGHYDPARTTGDLYIFEQEIKNHLVAFDTVVQFAREGDTIAL